MGLFDKIVSKATEVGSEAAREAGKAAEIAPIKLSIHGLQGKRQEAVEEFGKLALRLYREGSIAAPELADLAVRIDGIEREIADKESQMQAVEMKYRA